MDNKLNILPRHNDTKEGGAACGVGRFPKWLHRKMPAGDALWNTHSVVSEKRLHTVCEEAKCPNILECYSKKTATFLILGKSCTRACGFCDIAFSPKPQAPDPDEPKRVAESVQALGLKHVVITMVARDDLTDGGSIHLVEVIHAIRKENPGVTIETLTSDFQADKSAIDRVLDANPEIFNHNIETVRRLTPSIRHKATYERTLEVLAYAKKKHPTILVKSGLMVGLGEEKDEVLGTLQDLKEASCDIVTIGQYLQASHKKLTVKAFVTPELFTAYEQAGISLGIPHMYVGPFVRSSYNAGLFVKKNNEMVLIEST
jgi:lipoic acid synthetase